MRSGGIELFNIDCMEYMSTVPDKHFDLAIVDPPYGINVTDNKSGMGRRKGDAKAKYKIGDWDSATPSGQYFDELFRVSKNQIVWGGNYFLPLWQSPCKGFFIWNKMFSDEVSFAQVEFAWTSFDITAKMFTKHPVEPGRIHPTQKPVELYKWILKTFALEGWTIFDSHLGSGSIAIACHDYKFELTACEIDKDYYDAAVKRYSNHIAQTSLF